MLRMCRSSRSRTVRRWREKLLLLCTIWNGRLLPVSILISISLEDKSERVYRQDVEQ